MKKVVSLIAATSMAIGIASTACADLNIVWLGSFGFIDEGSDGSVGILGAGENTYAQLIYSTDDMADPAMPDGMTSGDDRVMATFDIANTGAAFEDFAAFSAPNHTEAFSGGFVYGRIFESDTVVAGTKYYDGPVAGISDIVPPASPQSYDLNTNFVTGNELTLSVIPEPTTLALLVVGFGAVLFRRRR